MSEFIFVAVEAAFEKACWILSRAFISLSDVSVLLRAATDHNADNTTAVLKEWLTYMQKYYHYVEWRPMDQPT